MLGSLQTELIYGKYLLNKFAGKENRLINTLENKHFDSFALDSHLGRFEGEKRECRVATLVKWTVFARAEEVVG